LHAYQRLRQALAEDLGIVPSQQLRELETAVLRQDPSLDAPPTGPATTIVAAPFRSAHRGVPAQLPLVAGFTGRTEQLSRLDGLLAHGGAPYQCVKPEPWMPA
jgi:hypothetical protein